jgi:alpha-amylase/alpha-mannosidase (GH57 family)
MERYICIHGHFYQPPRENAWLEHIETQDSAYPYHDWNERVAAECYATNAASRILDKEGCITHIVNNYSKISFDFGPTLLTWMEKNTPDVYQAIVEADREAQHTFSGHGSALAQPYNHVIMPLANQRDRYTQVIWAIRSFEHSFGRKPEGMWLPETAVDLETLDVLAELGIKFTILAPHQASRVRKIDTDGWNDTRNAAIDTRMAYEITLPSRRKLNIFFYDDTIARSVAFEDLLKSGDNFACRLVDAFSEEAQYPQLVNIATDGETYGHHHRFGEMALAFALHHIETAQLARITNYGEYLEKHPPIYEVEIIENTSWSCSHGIERWQSDCGCNGGRDPKWNQAWRAPLREAFDCLRDYLVPKYAEMAGTFLKDPWAARDDYIEVVLDRSRENIQSFFEWNCTRQLSESETVTVLKLLELQRNAMLMYTSCGWFFDELSGIETVQVIQYAGRVIQLARDLFGGDVESQFLERLELAKSNIPEYGNGRRIYERFVKPAEVDLTKVAAHFAVSSLFEQYCGQARIYCYGISIDDYHVAAAGKPRLAVGRVEVTSDITRELARLSFGVLHLGDHNVNAAVGEYKEEKDYQAMLHELTQTFSGADFPEVIRLLDKHFGTSTYSIKNLFLDEQRKVLDSILESALSGIEAAYHQVYERYYPPMRFLSDLGNPIPRSFQTAAEFILNSELRKAVSGDSLDPERIASILDETRRWNVQLDTEGLSYLLQHTLEGMMASLVSTPENIESLKKLLAAVQMLRTLPFRVDLWKVQNLYHKTLESTYRRLQISGEQGEAAREWLSEFTSLGEELCIRLD